jgi:hypothetical protein
MSSLIAGCAAHQERLALSPSSVQAVQYYPFQVKGFQNSYPRRTAAVLPAADARTFNGIAQTDHQPDQGRPAVGVIVDETGKIAQRLYGPPLDSLVQDAIARAAQEAGLDATAVNLPLQNELAARNTDYVIDTKIVRCWVTKSRGGAHPQGGPLWHATAEVALDVTIYKPPFTVPFWQGQAAAVYDDPPPSISGDNAGEAEIYEQPGEVLSVAMTRAVAAVFKRDDLHNLSVQDSMRAPRH